MMDDEDDADDEEADEGSAFRADVTLPQTLAGRCWRSWGSFFPNFRRPKRQLQHPQQAKHQPRHLQHDAGEAGDAKAAFFSTTFPDQKGSSRIPSMQSITPDTCRMMQVKLGMQKLLFCLTFEDQKRQLLHPQHAKHRPRHLHDAGDNKADDDGDDDDDAEE